MHLETKRLRLRPFELIDAPAFYAMNSDEVVQKYTGDIPFDSISATKDFITDYLENPDGQIKKHDMGRLSVIDKSTDRFIGFCGLKTHDAAQIVDIGYRFVREQWGKGYATEACHVVLESAFEFYRLDQVVAHIHEYNYGSQRVAEKLGFNLDHRFLWDGVLPGRYYKLTKNAYYDKTDTTLRNL
jgi:RimJ/RimL family protein N-acetyltransferase